MDLKSEFGFDPELAAAGVWIPLGANGARLLIAARDNRRLEAYMEPIERRFRPGGRGVPENIYEEAWAKFVLLSWEGIEEGGRPLEPTEENRLAMLKRYPKFKALVIREAGNFRNFQPQEDETKNS
jgi:hypothetical protein